MRPTFVPFLALFAVACNGGSESDTNVDPGDIDCEVDGAASAYTALWGIDGTEPDCEVIVTDDCPQGYHVAGNTRFYVGEVTWDADGAVCGYEAKVVYPNAQWHTDTPDVDDCLVVWSLSGTVTPDTGSYTYTLTMHAALDSGQSTCLSEYTQFEASSYDVVYHLTFGTDDVSTVFFESGNPFANGFGTDNGPDAAGAVTYASAGGCEILGSADCPI